MLWVPGLSLVVFLLVLIASTIYGFRRGWVYALCFSTTLWALTLTFVGINYALYKYLWKAFESLILDKNTRVKIDLDNLSSFYKLQIVLFATGLETVLIYPITFLIMWLLNKFIDKYFGHKVKRVSINEKEIFRKRNIIRSRVIGSSILTTSTLFSASLVASSLNTIFTPYKKTNFANSVNDFLGNIYSLGLGKNTKSSQIISDFIAKKLDSKLATSMRELVNFSSDETNTNNTFPNLEQLNYLVSRKEDFNDLFKNKDATTGVFSSVIRTNSQSINPLAFDPKTATGFKDESGNIIGYQKVSGGGDPVKDIRSLKKFTSENKFNLKLHKTLITLLVQRIKGNFIPFRKTIFYTSLLKVLNTQNEYKRFLKSRKQRKQDYENNIKDRIERRKRIISELNKIIGKNGVSAGDKETEAAVVFEPKTISRGMAPGLPEGSSFRKEFNEESRIKKALDVAREEKESADLEYQSHNTNVYNPSSEELNRLQQEYDELRSSLEILNIKSQANKDEIVKLEKDRKEAEQNRVRTEKAIEDLKENKAKELEKLDKIKANIIKLDRNLESNKKRQDQNDLEVANQRTKFNNLKIQLDRKQKSHEGITKKNDQLKTKKNQKIETYRLKNNEDRSQSTKVNKLISSYNDNISFVESMNAAMHDYRKSINVLMQENKSLNFSEPAQADSFSREDDGSIYYYEQAMRFMENRIVQKNEISRQKESDYNNLKQEIITSYTEWLRGN